MAKPEPTPGPDELVVTVMEELAGAAVVLDAKLAIVLATPEAVRTVGMALPVGASAVKLLCGSVEQRPIADALAHGDAVDATLVRPAADGSMRTLRVRGQPIVRGDHRLGFVLRFDEERRESAGQEPAVLFHGMWTRDPAMKRVFHILTRAAARDVSVLVRGPTGAGKELVAKAIHELSPRRAGPFRAINCAALPPNLLESELFGHVKGAFTGAVKDNPGIFRASHHGTLFLDEVAEMPLDLQAKLLRVLETRTVIPVGGVDPIAVDVRIVAATHQSLRAAVEAHRFRADLMYRLRVVPVFLPPLADRVGDVELLTEKLMAELDTQGARKISRLSRGALEALRDYDWPGNVRELRNALEYAYVIGDGDVLLASDLPPEIAGTDRAGAVNAPVESDSPESADHRLIRIALERSNNNRARAAQLLGLSRVTLWRRMKQLGFLDDETP